MDETENIPSRIKLELFFLDDKGEEVLEILLELRPGAGGGDDSVRHKIATTDEEAVKSAIENAAGYLAGTARNMPPGILSAQTDGQPEDLVVIRMPAGEGIEYVKNELPYGQHMVMLNAKIERDSQGRVKRIGGDIHLFKKLKPEALSENPRYKILIKKGEWKEIKDIDKYVDKHKLVVYKLNVDHQ